MNIQAGISLKQEIFSSSASSSNIMLSLLCHAPLFPATAPPIPTPRCKQSQLQQHRHCLLPFSLQAFKEVPLANIWTTSYEAIVLVQKSNFSMCSTLTLSSSPVSYISLVHFWKLVWTGAFGSEPTGHWRQSPSWWPHRALKHSFLAGPLKKRIEFIRADHSEEPQKLYTGGATRGGSLDEHQRYLLSTSSQLLSETFALQQI